MKLQLLEGKEMVLRGRFCILTTMDRVFIFPMHGSIKDNHIGLIKKSPVLWIKSRLRRKLLKS